MGRKQFFINVDLEVSSKGKLDVMIADFDKRMRCLFAGRNRGVSHAHYEVPGIIATPEVTIQMFIREIDKLTPAGKKQWDAAKLRELVVGAQSGDTPRILQLEPIGPETLAECARVGCAVSFTLYGAID